ncbi:MAG: hypothetical protein ABSB97_05090 [Thermoplasmata archaeon]|jgi:hypothetical protein
MMGAYDYYRKRFCDYLSSSKGRAGYVPFLRWVRRKCPSDGRIYLSQDSLSTHTTPAAVAEAREVKIAFVPTPTNASHPNPDETHFRTIRWRAFTASNYAE